MRFCSLLAVGFPALAMGWEPNFPDRTEPRFHRQKHQAHDPGLTQYWRDINENEFGIRHTDNVLHKWDLTVQHARPFCPAPPLPEPSDDNDFLCPDLAQSTQLVSPCPGGSSILGCKHFMCQFLGDEDFVPPCYFMPEQQSDYDALDVDPMSVWFMKPQYHQQTFSLLAKDIPDKARRFSRYLLQKRAENPYLWNGKKVEFRVYVLTTSYDPPRFFLHHQLYIKTGAKNYSAAPEDADNKCMHVLNLARQICPWEDGDPYIDWQVFKEKIPKADMEEMWTNIRKVVAKSTLKVADKTAAFIRPCIHKGGGCFSLQGYDLVVNADNTMSLLEVNECPQQTKDPYFERHDILADAMRILEAGGYDRSGYLDSFNRKVDQVFTGELAHLKTEENVNFMLRLYDEYYHRGDWEIVYPTSEHLSRYSHLVKGRDGADIGKILEAWDLSW